MQSMVSVDSPKNDTVFKKRIHRPWKPALLETSTAESPSLFIQKPENKLSIGGFLSSSAVQSHDEVDLNNALDFMNDLKTQENTLLESANDLKIAQALEQAEKMAYAKEAAETARKTAEERALQAIQQAKYAAAHIYKVEQQLNTEKQNRLTEENAKKALEAKIQKALQMIQEKDQKLQQAEKAQQLTEARITEITAISCAAEQRIREEAKARVKKLFARMSQRIIKIQSDSDASLKNASQETARVKAEADKNLQAFQAQITEQINNIKADRDVALKNMQHESNAKIQELQAQCHTYEQAKLSAEAAIEKYTLIIKESENSQKELINKLTISQKSSAEIRLHLEQKIETLTQTITTSEQEKNELETQKAKIEQTLSESVANIKNLQCVIKTERSLRKILEEKLTGSQVRQDEQKRKLAENKICELTAIISHQEIEKNKVDAAAAAAIASANQLEIKLGSEKTIRNALEEELKNISEHITTLEQEKQNEIEAKQLAEHKLKLLLNQQEHHEQEKSQYAEKLKFAHDRIQALTNTHEVELSKAYEHAHQLTVQHEIQIGEMQDATHQLTMKYEAEINKKQDEAHQSAVENKRQLNAALQRIHELEALVESEKALRKEADRLKALEEQSRKAAQEKINAFVEQVNQTVSNVLGPSALVMPIDGI